MVSFVRGVLSDVFVAGVDCSSERPLIPVEDCWAHVLC